MSSETVLVSSNAMFVFKNRFQTIINRTLLPCARFQQAVFCRFVLLAGIVLSQLIVFGTGTDSNAQFADSNNRFDFRVDENLARQDDSDEHKLEPGKHVGRELAGGQTHGYQISLSTGQYLRVIVEELGIDVVVRLFAPDNKKILEVDNPNESRGIEQVSMIVGTPGRYRVDVLPRRKTEPLGRYEIELDELRPATAQDKTRIDAEQLFTEAELLRSKRTVESLRKAVEKYQEAQANYDTIGDLTGIAATLVCMGKAHYSLGESERTIELYKKAATIYENQGDKRNTATAFHRIGVIYDRLGNKQSAIDFLKRALALRLRLPNNVATAETLYYIGTVFNDVKDTKSALESLNEALPLHRLAGDRAGEATTLNYLGDIYLNLEDNKKTLESYNQALTLRHDLGDQEGEAETLTNLGLFYLSIDETENSLKTFEQARSIENSLDDPFGKVKALIGLGMVYSRMLEHTQALKHFSEASQLSQKAGAVESAAMALISMGMVYSVMGDTDNALKQYDQALPFLKLLKDPAAEAARLFSVGLLYVAREEFDKSLDSFNQCASLSRQVGEARMVRWSSVFIGISYYKLDKFKEALGELESVLPMLRRVGDSQYQALALATIGAIERDTGKFDAARAHIEHALSILESMRLGVVSQDLRISFFAGVQSYFGLYIDLLMRLQKQRPTEGLRALAFETSERSRARSLLELLSETQTDIREGVNPALLKRERSLRQKLGYSSFSRRRLLGGIHTAAEAVATANEIEALTTEYREVNAEIRRTSPHYANLTQPQALNLDKIQKQLDPDTLLLEYALDEEGCYLWLVSPTEIESYELPGRKEIEAISRAYSELLRTEQNAESVELSEKASRLSRILLGPVASRLGQKRLVIVANGALQTIPFAALPDPMPMKPGMETSQPLIIQHEIIGLPSMSVLAALRSELAGRKHAGNELIVLADPVFYPDDVRVNKSSATNKSGHENPAPQTTVVQFGGRLDRLPGTRNEANGIIALARTNLTRKALDFDAGRELVTGGELSKYRYIHFATHGLPDNIHPELTAIVLSLVDKNGNPRDGFLRAHEIYNLTLSADLVVLSACETGLGKDVRGEGLIGLTRGFMYAGAARMIVSLWAVRDESTARLMTSVYRGMIRDGKPPAAALRSAQIEMLRSNRWRAPYYWAPFVLQGEWR